MKDLKVTFAEVAKKELRNMNKDHFGSYSAFGIHREMLSDKVRTDTYRDTMVANPTLLKNTVVMDVRCGKGILSTGRGFKGYCSRWKLKNGCCVHTDSQGKWFLKRIPRIQRM